MWWMKNRESPTNNMPEFTPENAASLPRGGNVPSPDEALREYQRQQSFNELSRYARLTDPRVNMLTAVSAMALHNGDRAKAVEWMGTDAGKASRETLGILGSHGVLGGGSPVALMAGVNQMAAASNFRMGMYGGTAQLYGGGALTDMVSRRVFDDMREKMFSRSTGMADLKQTQGFGKEQMGEIFSMMGQRRMFQGMNVADFSQDAGGKVGLKINEQTFTKIRETFTDTAKMLSSIRDLVGDRSIAELARSAESLAGLSLRSAPPAAISQRIDRLRTVSRTMGLDMGSVASLQQSIAGLGAGQVGYGQASVMALDAIERSAIAVDDRAGAVRAARDRGEYMASFSDAEVAQQGMSSQLKLMRENPFLSEAAFALQNFSGPSEKRADLDAALRSFSSVSGRDEREAAAARLKDSLEQFTGSSAGTLTRLYGTSGLARGLGPDGQNLLAQITGDMDQSMNRSVFRNLTGSLRNYQGTGMNASQAGDAAHFFFSSFAGDTQQKLIEALGSGNMDSVKSIMDAQKDMFAGQGVSQTAVDNFMGAAGQNAKGLGGFLSDTRRLASPLRAFSNMTSAESRRRMAEKRITDGFYANAVGDPDARYKLDTVESIARGMLGGRTIDNQMLLDFTSAANGGRDLLSFKSDKNGVVSNSTDAQKLSDMLNTYEPGALTNALGLGKDASGYEVMKALQTDKGRLAYQSVMQRTGAAYNVDFSGENAGRTRMMGKAARDRAKSELDIAGRAFEQAVLSGASDEDLKNPKFLKDAADRLRIEDSNAGINGPAAPTNGVRTSREEEAAMQAFSRQQSLVGALTGDAQFIDKALTNPASPQFQALERMMRRDPKMLEGTIIKARDKVIADKDLKDEEKRDKLEKLQDLQRKIEGKSDSVAERQLAVQQQMLIELRKPTTQ